MYERKKDDRYINLKNRERQIQKEKETTRTRNRERTLETND